MSPSVKSLSEFLFHQGYCLPGLVSSNIKSPLLGGKAHLLTHVTYGPGWDRTERLEGLHYWPCWFLFGLLGLEMGTAMTTGGKQERVSPTKTSAQPCVL